MANLGLQTNTKRIESPDLEQVWNSIQDAPISLEFQSQAHCATLVGKYHPELGVAFWYCEHEKLERDGRFQKAIGTGPMWVTVMPEDSLELITYSDGQDDHSEPRMYYLEVEDADPILLEFMKSGRRSDVCKWELEDDVIDRLGSQGCFDGIE